MKWGNEIIDETENQITGESINANEMFKGCSSITRIDFLGKDGKFYHTHISAIYLEAVEIHTDIAKDTAEAYYRTAILIASNFIRGTENSIEELQMCCDTYTKLIKKNK